MSMRLICSLALVALVAWGGLAGAVSGAVVGWTVALVARYLRSGAAPLVVATGLVAAAVGAAWAYDGSSRLAQTTESTSLIAWVTAAAAWAVSGGLLARRIAPRIEPERH